MNGIDGIDAHWLWAALGLALLTAEMLVPGVFLLWFGLAALATAVLVFATDPSLPVQIVSFSFLALIFAYSAKRFVTDRPIASSDPLLNNRAARLVGEVAVVSLPLDGGRGRVRLGDSEWQAEGPDLPLGERVRVTGTRGTVLLVERSSGPVIEIRKNPADDAAGDQRL
ncbi:NfeD family protein [Erythrobacteraceae bacterium CFH 75059]|uniref:NfeD family protein n=1 Tax=Qipengyuania thermophila TaxID=2509361 RepID=UPI00101E966F|nr:NfeD family protein [Qipengyuania thermophila]TCD06384.1 NfeD family protein [Erythrobacteraceae bacterium CFH 75059]